MPLKRVLGLGLLGLALSACASAPKVSDSLISSVTSGEKGVILTSFGGTSYCSNLSIRYKNTKTGEVKTAAIEADWMQSAENVQKKIALTSVEPGTYKFSDGSCKIPTGNGYIIESYRGLPMWFGDVEVKAGEAVYAGTLVEETIGHKVDGVLDFVPEFIMKAPTDDYQVFSLEDRSDQIKQRLSEDAPMLSTQFTTKMFPQKLHTKTVKQILRDAYAKDSDGKYPDAGAASRAARLSFTRYLISGVYKPES